MGGINLDNLRITNGDLDQLTGLDISDLSMGWGTRLSIFRHPRLRWHWLLNQGLVLGVSLVLWLPVSLVLGRSLDQGAKVFLGLGCGVAIATALAYGFYGLHRGRQLQRLNHLLDEVDRFNDMIQSVEILAELGQADRPSQRLTLDNPDAVKEALHLTRESLVCGLMSDKIMRKHQRFISRRHELFANIETNVSSVRSLQTTAMAEEYAQLLNEALEVGTAVHQELGHLQTPRPPGGGIP